MFWFTCVHLLTNREVNKAIETPHNLKINIIHSVKPIEFTRARLQQHLVNHRSESVIGKVPPSQNKQKNPE